MKQIYMNFKDRKGMYMMECYEIQRLSRPKGECREILTLSRTKKVFLTEKAKILFQKYFFLEILFLPSELGYSK